MIPVLTPKGPQYVRQITEGNDTNQKLGSAAGIGIGGALGSIIPGAGTIAGAGIGGTIGALAGSFFNKKPKVSEAPLPPEEQMIPIDSSAMQQRIASIGQDDPLIVYSKAMGALHFAPDHIQKEYMPPLLDGYMQAYEKQYPQELA